MPLEGLHIVREDLAVLGEHVQHGGELRELLGLRPQATLGDVLQLLEELRGAVLEPFQELVDLLLGARLPGRGVRRILRGTSLLLDVALAEVDRDHGDADGDDNHTSHSRQAADDLASDCMGHHVAVADRCQRGDGPPEGGGDGREGRGAVAVHPGILAHLGLREEDERRAEHRGKAHHHQDNDEPRPGDLHHDSEDDVQRLRVARELRHPQHPEDTDEPHDADHAQRPHGLRGPVHGMARRQLFAVLARSQDEQHQLQIPGEDGEEVDDVVRVGHKLAHAVTRVEPQRELQGEDRRDAHLPREEQRTGVQLGHRLQNHGHSAHQDDGADEVVNHRRCYGRVRVVEQVADVLPALVVLGQRVAVMRGASTSPACIGGRVLLHGIAAPPRAGTRSRRSPEEQGVLRGRSLARRARGRLVDILGVNQRHRLVVFRLHPGGRIGRALYCAP
mmetsp:Transcript_43693/g.129337  ORF Transcript_43693/g.129337 Transcript_43693/m.129337 type:complete len:448 (+) Transcript_43693:62-1405(+)